MFLVTPSGFTARFGSIVGAMGASHSPSTADIKCTPDAASIMGETLSKYIIPAAVDAVEIAEQRAGSTPPKRWPKLSVSSIRCEVQSDRPSPLLHDQSTSRAPRALRLLARSRNGAVRSASNRHGRPRRRSRGVPVVRYDGTRRGKAWDDFEASHPGATILTATEYDTAQACRNAIWYNGEAFKHCGLGIGINERLIEWDFNGVPFRSTPDRYYGPSDAATLVELKTTRSAQPARFLRDATSRWYHSQLAVYRAAPRRSV